MEQDTKRVLVLQYKKFSLLSYKKFTVVDTRLFCEDKLYPVDKGVGSFTPKSKCCQV